MAIIPLKQSVIHRPLIGEDPDWGTPNYGEELARACRFQETTKLVRDSHGTEVISVGTFFFASATPVGYADTLTYTDEHGKTTEYRPLSIGVKRALSGKALLTEVNV